MKKQWLDVTDNFSEEERHYKKTYLEISEVYGDDMEVGLFTSDEVDNEIYFSWDYFYGVIYAEKEKVHALWKTVKKELQEEHDRTEKPEEDFVNAFAEKYKVDFMDALIDTGEIMQAMFDMTDIFKWDE